MLIGGDLVPGPSSNPEVSESFCARTGPDVCARPHNCAWGREQCSRLWVSAGIDPPSLSA